MNDAATNSWPYEAAESNDSTRDLPCKCTLPSEDIASLSAERRKSFFPGIVACDEISNGYVFWFRRDQTWLQKVVDFAMFESQCCAFLDFGIGFTAGGDLISLRISDAAGHATKLYAPLRDEVADNTAR